MPIALKIRIWTPVLALCAIMGSLSAEAAKFDHSHLLAQKVLKKYVKVTGASSTVNYKALKASPNTLNEYVKSIQMVSKPEFMKWNKKQQLAFLINAYNMYTLKLIIEKYPVKSIRDIGSMFKNTWNKKFDWQKLFGEQVTLDNIEHDMIREKKDDLSNKLVKVKYAEPRIHFAVNCASIGCPHLPRYAFTGPLLDQQLEQEARKFFSQPRNFEINHQNKTVLLSSIMDWYADDFIDWLKAHYPEQEKYSLLDYVAHYVSADLAKELRGAASDYSIQFIPYDWNLNDSKTQP